MRRRTSAWLIGFACVLAVSAVSASAALAAPTVSAPGSVAVGQRVTIDVSHFKPTWVRVTLSPTASRGGSCCAIVVADHVALHADGSAAISFTWPARYYRCGGGCPEDPNADWVDGERADIDVSALNPSQFARTSARVRVGGVPPGSEPPPDASEPGGPAAGLTVSWTAPLYSGTLWTLVGGTRVPFDLRVDASVAGSAALAAGAEPRFLDDPLKLYSIEDGGEKLTFSLMRASWDPPEGMSGPDTSVALALAWPQIKDGRLELPLLTGSTVIGLNREFAQISLTGELKALLATDVEHVAKWIVARGYLPSAYQAAAVAEYLTESLGFFAVAYRFPLDAQALKAKVDAWLAQAPLAAQEIGLVIEGLAEALQTRVREVQAVVRRFKQRVGGAADSIYRHTLGRIAIADATTARPRSAAGARADAPLGLRGRLAVRAVTRSALRAGRVEPLTSGTARTAAHALLRPFVGVSVGPLLVARRSARSRTVTIAAAALSSAQVVVTVVGPGYAAEAPLATRDGVAGATLTLPARHGRYRIGIADLGAAPRARLGVGRVRVG